MKIVLVGAFPPQEKGEAHYLGRYARELSATFSDVSVVSQYVSVPSVDSWNGITVDRAIADRSETGVSYSRQGELVRSVLRTGADIMHLHYGPNPDYGGRLGEPLIGAMRALRRSGVRTVLTLHSLWLPPDVEDQAARLGVPGIARGLVTGYFGWFQRALLGSTDKVLCLVSGEKSPLTEAYARAYRLRGLGEEVHGCECRFNSDEAFRGTEEPLFFAFGFLRPDKGFDVLIKAFDIYVRAGGRGRLLIAGRAQSSSDEDYADKVLSAASRVPMGRCAIERRFLSDAELEERLQGCDVIVLPYLRNVGASGPLHHALGVGKPVIATSVGHNLALNKTVHLVEPGDSVGLARSLERFSSSVVQRDYANLSRSTARERSWTRLAQANYDIYRSLLP